MIFLFPKKLTWNHGVFYDFKCSVTTSGMKHKSTASPANSAELTRDYLTVYAAKKSGENGLQMRAKDIRRLTRFQGQVSSLLLADNTNTNSRYHLDSSKSSMEIKQDVCKLSKKSGLEPLHAPLILLTVLTEKICKCFSR